MRGGLDLLEIRLHHAARCLLDRVSAGTLLLAELSPRRHVLVADVRDGHADRVVHQREDRADQQPDGHQVLLEEALGGRRRLLVATVRTRVHAPFAPVGPPLLGRVLEAACCGFRQRAGHQWFTETHFLLLRWGLG